MESELYLSNSSDFEVFHIISITKIIFGRFCRRACSGLFVIIIKVFLLE